MDIQAAETRCGQNVIRQDQTIGGHDQEIQIVASKGFSGEARWVPDRQAPGQRERLHRAWPEFPATTGRAVRLSQHKFEGMAAVDECREDGGGEGRSSGETEAQ